ncbi:MoaD/ThiS family protein [Chloroflexota bacterium]
MKVNIEVMSWLKEDFGLKTADSLVFEETVKPGTTVMDLLHLIAKRYPKFSKNVSDTPKQDFFDYCLVILNKKIITNPAELKTGLKEGDNVTLSPAFYGG